MLIANAKINLISPHAHTMHKSRMNIIISLLKHGCEFRKGEKRNGTSSALCFQAQAQIDTKLNGSKSELKSIKVNIYSIRFHTLCRTHTRKHNNVCSNCLFVEFGMSTSDAIVIYVQTKKGQCVPQTNFFVIFAEESENRAQKWCKQKRYFAISQCII